MCSNISYLAMVWEHLGGEDFLEEMRRGWEGLDIVYIGPTSCPLSASWLESPCELPLPITCHNELYPFSNCKSKQTLTSLSWFCLLLCHGNVTCDEYKMFPGYLAPRILLSTLQWRGHPQWHWTLRLESWDSPGTVHEPGFCDRQVDLGTFILTNGEPSVIRPQFLSIDRPMAYRMTHTGKSTCIQACLWVETVSREVTSSTQVECSSG